MAVKRVTGFVLSLALAVAIGGCDSSADTGDRPSMDQLAQAASAQRAAEQQKEQQTEAKRKAQEEAQAAAQEPAEPPRQVAGRARVGEGGYFTAIVGARRHILNEVDSYAWKQAVQHFKATEGRKPKDHEEFMKKIVIPLEIDLGYKEEDQEFFYDPDAESEGDLGVVYVVEEVPAQEAANAAESPSN